MAAVIACPDRALVEVVEPADEMDPRTWLDAARTSIWGTIWEELRPGPAALAAALVLGVRDDVDPALRSAAAETGLLHLIAISGLHVALIVGTARALLGLVMPARAADLAASVLALLYAALAGAGTPIIRAATAAGVVFIGRAIGRSPRPYTALSVAVVVLLSADPADLFRPGFQLSVAAVIGLLSARRALPAPDRHRVVAAAIASLRTSTRCVVATLPIVVHHFGVVTPLAPLLTTLCAPLFVTTFLATACFALLAPWLPGAVLLAAPAGLLLDGLACFFRGASSVPFSHLLVPRPGLLSVAGLGAFVVARDLRRPRLAAALLAVSIGGAILHYRPPDDTELWFLDVGHGQAALLRTREGETVMFDAGARGDARVAERTLIPALDALGVLRIDRLVVSHGDADHTNGIEGLIRCGRVRSIVRSRALEETQTNRAWLAAATRGGVPVEIASGPVPLVRRAREVAALAFPLALPVDATENDRSLIVELEVDGVRVLLPGDIERTGTRALLRERPHLNVDLLVLPHHGNRAPWMSPLLHRARPTATLASRGGPFTDDIVPTLAARSGAMLWSTADHGAIVVRFRNDGWRGTFRASRFPWSSQDPPLPVRPKSLSMGDAAADSRAKVRPTADRR